MLTKSLGLVVASLPFSLAAVARQANSASAASVTPAAGDDNVMKLMGAEPELPRAPGSSSLCTWWIDHRGDQFCQSVPDRWGITMEEFLWWNPSVSADCNTFPSGFSYCVEAWDDIPGVTTAKPGPTTSASSSQQPPATSTAPSNGVSTPMPTQPGMVTNCNKFHWINSANVKCDAVISYQKISRDDFLKWNPTVKSDCSGMQIGVNVCVGVIAEAPAPSPTQTTGGNGVVTPLPIQPSMVPNCNKFHWIANKNVKCADVLSYQKISLADFAKWNPSVNSDCSGMWAEVNVCVGVIGGSTAPQPSTTTTAGNGIQTPQPTQPGMVENCNKFHWIAKNVNCDQVISYQKITRADFVKWNPTVLDDCRGMWAEVNVCVGVIGGSTAPQPSSTTTAGNGIQTPQPIQPGMVDNCKKFHWIANSNVKCQDVISYQKITLADFYKWNPGVGADCRNMWAGVHQCVGV